MSCICIKIHTNENGETANAWFLSRFPLAVIHLVPLGPWRESVTFRTIDNRKKSKLFFENEMVPILMASYAHSPSMRCAGRIQLDVLWPNCYTFAMGSTQASRASLPPAKHHELWKLGLIWVLSHFAHQAGRGACESEVRGASGSVWLHRGPQGRLAWWPREHWKGT
jgi:hypothetical protein